MFPDFSSFCQLGNVVFFQLFPDFPDFPNFWGCVLSNGAISELKRSWLGKWFMWRSNWGMYFTFSKRLGLRKRSRDDFWTCPHFFAFFLNLFSWNPAYSDPASWIPCAWVYQNWDVYAPSSVCEPPASDMDRVFR